MSKNEHKAESKTTATTTPSAVPQKGPTDGNKPEAKKTEHKNVERPQSKSKGHEPVPGHCCGWGCKALATRFNFCSEHFDHFKFGLLKKTGEPVPDYEKKFEHYQAYRAKLQKSVQKAA